MPFPILIPLSGIIKMNQIHFNKKRVDFLKKVFFARIAGYAVMLPTISMLAF
jgi:hypothetical protein